MAKNTFSSAFRKIDVDQYCEDNYKEDEVDQVGPQGPDENDVKNLLSKYPFYAIDNGKVIDALKLVLANAPLGCKNQQIKENALNLTLKVLLSIKPSQIEEAVNSLDMDLLDVLMKYVYKGFENPSEGSSGHLLVWHEKVYSIGGVGCIEYLLENVSTFTLNQIWKHLSDELKKDEELQSRLPCLEHYNRDDAIMHIDGPPPAKYRCLMCRNVNRQERNIDRGSRSLR
ncbi:unnamed protein product [Ceutorhynchus assimilis]|uniref:Actin-related protein 2/3 complex subunit 5 n=1 Tax=Ceutorhynchus assimilis TaxID=467358 RepID=A0A9N9QRG1_9CUCU|nr:unnamed protein product [Ceutorhynchus assimilis]